MEPVGEQIQESSLPLVKRRGRRKISTPQELIQVTEGRNEANLPTVPKRKKRSKPNNRLPKEIIQIALPETQLQETSEIMLRREFSGDDIAELIGKLLAGANHAYVAELKITQTK